MRIIIKSLSFLVLLIISLSSGSLNAQAKAEVLIVLGSDTAIWDGMSTTKYHDYYNQALYTDPSDNAYEVMSSSFRDNLKDSYGQTMKLTWWMMAGNIFRYATNTNVPVPNIMTMYLMKKYYLESIEEYGDELTLHYHTFLWSDYDNDGKSYWNQAKSFMDCFDDFNFTLAQLLLEEEVFPVSFRSGWHYMDNDWQSYLNELLPFSMHNAYPSKKTTWDEPANNVIDWSMAPSEWIPYHPSVENYQIPGPSKGWNLRSMHLSTSINTNVFEDLFEEADKGRDQVACIWGHLPEEDFNTNLAKIDELLHEADQKYPYVKFRYCTAIEAMQRWLRTSDHKAPEMSIEEITRGDGLYYRISIDETIFQLMPVVAVKDIYENYYLLRCRSVGDKVWETREPVSPEYTAKTGFAVCDYFGNQTIEIIRYYPDDIYIDNPDEGYQEIAGQWVTSADASWGTDSRKVIVQEDDSVRVRFTPDITKTAYYNIFVQSPGTENPASEMKFNIYENGSVIGKIERTEPLPDKEWQYIATMELSEGTNNYVEIVSGQAGKALSADVVKFSPLVTEKTLAAESEFIDLQSVSVLDTTWFELVIYNKGYKELTVSEMESYNGTVKFSLETPLIIEPMAKYSIPLYIYSENTGAISDTLFIYSDDPVNNPLKINVTGYVQNYFKLVDNEDAGYVETGVWHTSVAQAHSVSSRYSFLTEPAGTRADFNFVLPKAGIYNAEFIVPETVNSANSALYTISVDGYDIDSVHVDQNLDSGGWVSLGKYNLPSSVPVSVSVINDKTSTEGAVLRADAVTLNLVHEITNAEEENFNAPDDFSLSQNYPNPFNPATTINYSLPAAEKGNIASLHVELIVYDMLGQEVAILVNKEQTPGKYGVNFNAGSLPSGVYFYTLKAGDFQETKKLMLMK